MNEKPNYYAIIPAGVRYDDRLIPNAKLLYAEITALCNLNGQCFATNDYFSNLFNVSKVSISKWINQLVEYGYINSQIEYKDGTKEILNRYLTLATPPIKENFNTLLKKSLIPIKEKFKDNIINNNNNITYSNNNPPLYSPLERVEKRPNEKDKYREVFEEFWKAYPKQRIGNKQKAYLSYVRVLQEKRASVEQLLSSVKAYACSREVSKGFAKGCQAWLNDDRFNVDYSAEQQNYLEDIFK